MLPADNVAPAEKEKEFLMIGSGGANLGLGVTSLDGGSVSPELRSDETDAMTLRATLTFETGTTAVAGTLGDHGNGLDVMTGGSSVPNILVSDERGQSRAVAQHQHQHHSSPPSAIPTLAPRVTEAILQTQTRRRAQLQQQAHAQAQPSPSASSSPLPMGAVADVGDMLTQMQTQTPLPLPAQAPRPGHKGRFKSSPLVSSMSSVTLPRVAVEENFQGIRDDKGVVVDESGVPQSDPELKDPKEGL